MQYKLTIIIPTYNEQNTILEVLDNLHSQPELASLPIQIIVIDDGSSDNTTSLLQHGRYGNKEHIKIILNEKNQGKGSAIKSALPHIQGEYIIIQDADLENSVHDIPRLLNKIEQDNLSVLYGSRRLGVQNSHEKGNWIYYLGGNFITTATNCLYNQKLTDAPTCYKMFKSELFKSIPLKQNGFEFCQEITAHTAKKGIKITEIPIKYFPRTKAQGKKLSWKHGIKALWTLVKHKFIK